MSNRALQVAAFVAATTISGAVGAASEAPAFTEQKTYVVHYPSGDLDTAAGAEHMYQTLFRVARYVCGDDGWTRELAVVVEFKRCEHTAVANAVSGASNANLTTAYNRHFPNEPLIEKERLSAAFSSPIVLVALSPGN
jgi:UrcA family protein